MSSFQRDREGNMNGKLVRVVFWGLVIVFVAAVMIFIIPPVRELLLGGVSMFILGVVLLLFGIGLIYLALKKEAPGLLKKFLVLTGACAAGIPVSIFLHNAIYGAFIYFFNGGFWDKVGLGDEPFFFILGIIVCPLGFLVGAIGSIVQIVRNA
jgi:hypothetical protein